MDTKSRLLDLLAERATIGLADGDAQELEALLDVHPEWANDSFDLAAAAVFEALAPPAPPLPAHLRSNLQALGARHIASISSPAPSPAETAAPSPPLAEVISLSTRVQRAEPGQVAAVPAWSGWLAAAAALVIAALAWWPAVMPVAGPDRAGVDVQAMLAEPDALRLAWQATADPAATGASGEVVWSGTRQAGFMRIRGLATNDPGRSQYQLWVFDAQRDDRFPVDGGVFDIPAGRQEVIVPIDIKLPVDEAVMFAVTVEAPGGVVVSSRERVALLAQAEAED